MIFLIILTFLLIIPPVYSRSFQEGLALYKLGNYPKAENIFREMLVKDPRDYKSKYMLAVTLVNLQRYNEAKELYKDIITNSQNEGLVNLSSQGLNNIGGFVNTEYSYKSGVTKAVLNVNIAAGVIIIDDVFLNNSLKTKFVLDTGASYTTISKKIASQLKISTAGAKKIKIMTGSGYIDAPLVKIPEIEVKGLVVRNVEAIVADLPMHTSGADQGIAGLLGLSFLEDFKVTVDRANYKVTLEKN